MVLLMNNKNMFSSTKERKLKPFLISFAVFFIILICCSFFLFMNSINYDFDNLVEKNTTEVVQNETEGTIHNYYVSDLSGKSNILFAVKDDADEIDLAFIVIADFDAKTMQVEFIDDKSAMTRVYATDGEKGLKANLSERYNFPIDKYAIFDDKDFKSFLSKFEGIKIDLKSKVEYKSHEFNLTLEAGKQSVSGDIAYKLLTVVDNDAMENLLCDIIDSVLIPKYIDKSDSLFKTFVNSCITDISIVDYTDKIESLKIYSYADDKFKPTPYKTRE